jgi:hypothetical protein
MGRRRSLNPSSGAFASTGLASERGSALLAWIGFERRQVEGLGKRRLTVADPLVCALPSAVAPYREKGLRENATLC